MKGGGTTSMRHRVKTNKLNRSASHRKAMLNNMARSVFESGSIITTTAKAKEVRPLVENIITKAKKSKYYQLTRRKSGFKQGNKQTFQR